MEMPEFSLARDGVSREVPCSALKGETVPDSLPAEGKLGVALESLQGRRDLT